MTAGLQQQNKTHTSVRSFKLTRANRTVCTALKISLHQAKATANDGHAAKRNWFALNRTILVDEDASKHNSTVHARNRKIRTSRPARSTGRGFLERPRAIHFHPFIFSSSSPLTVTTPKVCRKHLQSVWVMRFVHTCSTIPPQLNKKVKRWRVCYRGKGGQKNSIIGASGDEGKKKKKSTAVNIVLQWMHWTARLPSTRNKKSDDKEEIFSCMERGRNKQTKKIPKFILQWKTISGRREGLLWLLEGGKRG